MANQSELPQVFETEAADVFVAEGHGEETHHAEPIALGLTPGGWVGLAMLFFILILVWKGVHKLILGGLDSKIAAIRENLDEAKKLREEAEALRAEYAAKIANAEKDAEAMLDHAKSEADVIVKKATADTKAMIARREKMAADKIAAAERQALDDLRAKAVDASAAAAKALIADRHDAAADSALADKVISNI
jgi:F-type H+-transporting ATPase subunit b